jgi:hypothetical protein
MSLTSLEVRNLQWRKAKRSAGNGACVEVAAAIGHILVRDSKDQDGPMVGYPTGSWREFISDVKKDRLSSARMLRHSLCAHLESNVYLG